jgi:hypothetical protein
VFFHKIEVLFVNIYLIIINILLIFTFIRIFIFLKFRCGYYALFFKTKYFNTFQRSHSNVNLFSFLYTNVVYMMSKFTLLHNFKWAHTYLSENSIPTNKAKNLELFGKSKTQYIAAYIDVFYDFQGLNIPKLNSIIFRTSSHHFWSYLKKIPDVITMILIRNTSLI